MYLAVLVTTLFASGQADSLTIRYVANAGVELSDGATTLLVDLPYVSGAFDLMTYDPSALAPAGPGAPPKLILHLSPQDTTRPPVPSVQSYPANPLFVVPNGRGTLIRNAVHVAFADSASGTIIQAFLTKYGATIIGGRPLTGTYILEIPDPGPDLADLNMLIDSMQSEPGVELVYEVDGVPEQVIRSRFP